MERNDKFWMEIYNMLIVYGYNKLLRGKFVWNIIFLSLFDNCK